MKMRKSKHNHEIVEKENLKIVALLRKLEKNNDFYNRVIIAIKQNALCLLVLSLKTTIND